MNIDINEYGYMEFFGNSIVDENVGRVTSAYTDRCRVALAEGERECMYGVGFGAPGRLDGVCAGDWIQVERVYDTMRLTCIFERKSCMVRRATGPVAHEQVLAANIDLALIVTSLNADYKPSRIERYLACAWDSGATPVVVLSKSDLCADVDEKLLMTERAAPGAMVLAVSAVSGEGMDALKALMRSKTSALVGMSGVGKSSLVNWIAGRELMKVNAIREDDARGRHTTTSRELIVLDDNIVVIDTPGMREMGLWGNEGVDTAYSDIAEIALGCRFSDCRHDKEPDCAVRAALEAGIIDKRRLRNYQALINSRRFSSKDNSRRVSILRREISAQSMYDD